MRVSEAGDRNAGVEIEISATIKIGRGRAVTARDRQLREQCHRLHPGRDELLLLLEERFGLRGSFSLSRHGHVW